MDSFTYADFQTQHPELFINDTDPNSLTIILDENLIKQWQDEKRRELTLAGAPLEWADIGIVFRDPYTLIVRDLVRFPEQAVKAGQINALGLIDEILHLVRNEADHERREHPLNRIMGIEDGSTGCVVATTDIHLPQRIGRALERAYDGELDVRYGEDEYVVRVRWHRG